MSPSQDDPTPQSDVKMVEMAKAGNGEAFTTLFQEHKSGVYGYLAGLVGNSEDAYDLTQKTFLNVWLKFHTLRDASRFKSWLYIIARNLAYDHRRSVILRTPSQSWEELEEKHTVTLSRPGPEEQVATAELVQLALAALPTKYRDCLLLQIEGGFSLNDIAEVMDISKESVSTYICNARKQFRQAYNHLEREPEAPGKRRSIP